MDKLREKQDAQAKHLSKPTDTVVDYHPPEQDTWFSVRILPGTHDLYNPFNVNPFQKVTREVWADILSQMLWNSFHDIEGGHRGEICPYSLLAFTE